MKNWDNVFASKDCIDALPCDALRDNIHLIPQGHGKALDLACGMGGNAIFLAQNSNLDVYAWDMSSVAITKLSSYADSKSLKIHTKVRDVEKYPPGNAPTTSTDDIDRQCGQSQEDKFDVIVVSYFLHRPTFQALLDSLSPNGILFYQTLIKDKTDPEAGPSNPKFLLDKNELLHLCKDLEILVYREEGTTGCITQGWRNAALIVAKKVL